MDDDRLMNTRLQIIQDLYGEVEDRDELRRAVQEDEVLHEEQRHLREAKFWLDHRPRSRPDPRVMEALRAAAAEGAAGTVPAAARRDRPPQPSSARHRRRYFGMGALLTLSLLVAAGIGWWGLDDGADLPIPYAEAPSDATPPASEEARQPAPAAGLTAADAYSPDTVGTSLPPDHLEWDAADDVLRLKRRIELVASRSPDAFWDEPAVPLEQLPATQSGRSAVRAAGGAGQ